MGNLMQKLTPEEVQELMSENQPNIKKEVKDSIVDEVRKDLLQRSELGIKKYNTTLDRKDLSHKEWLQMAYEEALDMALYLKRAIKE